MLTRSNLFLSALLVVQIVLLAISVFVTTGTESRTTEPLLAGMAAADVERITVADNLENQMTFARNEEGWVLPNADDFPLNGEQVDEILSKLEDMDTRRLVASNPANFARLEVKDDDYRRRIDLEAADSNTVLFLGGSGGADTVYVRRAGENEVYLGSGLSSWELSTQVSTWLDADYVNVPTDDVLEITVQNAEGAFNFLRDGESWTYTGLSDGEVFEDTKMPSILRNAATIRMQEPLGLDDLDEYGLVRSARCCRSAIPSELVKAEETEAEGSAADDAAESEETDTEILYTEATYTLTFGAALEDGDIVLKSSDAEYYVSVRDITLNAFSGISRSDLVKLPEAETEPSDG